MTSINLSGIQSIVVPLTIQVGDEVRVVHDVNNKYQQQEYALMVVHEEGVVGYIPCLNTIKKYIKKAEEDNDLRAYRNQRERYAITDLIRSNVISDLFRNHTEVIGKISRVQLDDDQEKVLSVTVSLDYM